MRRPAFTLVEAMVALGIGGVILFALWQVFASAQRDTVAAERRLQSVQVFQRLSQALEADLAQLIPVGPGGGLAVQDGGHAIEFAAVELDPQAPRTRGPIAWRTARVQFHADDHTVTRSARAGSGADAPIPGVKLLDLVFVRTAGPADGPPAPGPNGLFAAADCLLVHAVWAPLEDLAAHRTSRPVDVVPVSLPFGLPHLSDEARYPGLLPNLTSKPTHVGPGS